MADQAAELLPLQPGMAFGPYRLVRRLGVGGFAEVWEAERDDGTGNVALKILSAARGVEPSALDRFVQEGRIAAALSHPRTVYVFSAHQVGAFPVIAMELMRGGTLQDRLDRGERFTPAEVVETALDLLEGLEAAHRMGIVHRDVKPSNCLLDETGRVKIGDFGISRSVTKETRLTATGQIMGTPTFSAPEQIRGEDAQPGSDLYGLGATLYTLLEGHPPFEGRNWGEVVSRALTEFPVPPSAGGRAPAALQKLILQLLDKDIARRPSDYAALRAELLAMSTRPLPPAHPLRRTAAGLVDTALFVFAFIPAFAALGERVEHGLGTLVGLLVSFAIATVLEWRFGGTPGKLLLGLRISGSRAGRPSLREAALRNAIYLGVGSLSVIAPLLPAGRLKGLLEPGGLSGLIQFLLFVPMRRRNRYRAIHDLWSGTAVVNVLARDGMRERIRTQAHSASAPSLSVGRERQAYHLTRRLWSSHGTTLVLARDEMLDRDVWILEASGDQAVAPPQRPGRLRQLRTGGRPDAAWSAFEKPSGGPLLDRLSQVGASWGDVQSLLAQLLAEFETAAAAGDLPASLSFEQLWADEFERFTLLEFPSALPDPGATALWPKDVWPAFLSALVARLLELDSARMGKLEQRALPRQAVALLQRLSGPGLTVERLAEIRRELEALPGRLLPVRRSVRVAHLLVGQFVSIIVIAILTIAVVVRMARRSTPLPELELPAVTMELYFFIAVGLPAIALAWGFRGGPMLGMFGIQVFTADGRQASRGRCAWRAVLAAAPTALFLVVAIAAGLADASLASNARVPAPNNLDFEAAAAAASTPGAGAREPKPSGEQPMGWFLHGSVTEQYHSGIDRSERHGGSASAYLASAKADTAGFATLMQEFPATGLAGHRVRLTAFAKSADVANWAGVWFRVDGPWRELAFDNMEHRPIKGTTDWTRYELVLDAPKESKQVAFGVLLSGPGKVWADDFHFDVVGSEVAATGSPIPPGHGLGFAAGRLAQVLGVRQVSSRRLQWVILAACLGTMVLAVAGWVVAISSPARSLHDRVAGTKLMMR